MPKGGKKRTNAEYEREAEQAIKRFRKYPERLLAAQDEDSWSEFLRNIGIHEVNIENGSDYFEMIREKTLKSIDSAPDYRVSRLDRIESNRKVYIDYMKSTPEEQVYREVYSEKKIVYRNMKTGKFTKRIENE